MSMTAHSADFPSKVWLGMKRGEWPIEAFNTEDMAKRWAAQGGDGNGRERVRYIVGPVPIDPEMPARRAVTVPETTAWEAGDAAEE